MLRPKDYTALIESDGEEKISPISMRKQRSLGRNVAIHALMFVVIYVCGFASCIYIGSMRTEGAKSLRWLDDSVAVRKVVLKYNSTFSRVPAPEVDEAWQSLFPVGRGFIQDAGAAPEVSGVAVFHQLHCLDSIRLALYGVHHKGTQTMQAHHTMPTTLLCQPDQNLHDMAHIRHCLDYLRQSLMCHADTNLEPLNNTLGGITGWNSVKVCRDYEQVVEMASNLRVHDDGDIT